MIKTSKETRTEEVTVVDDYICNKCGNSLKDRCDMNYEGLFAEGGGGYASKIGDCTKWDFCLCEDCLVELFKTFKVPVTMKSTFFGEEW